MRATANKRARTKKFKGNRLTPRKKSHIKAMTKIAIDKLTKKRQANCRKREDFREGERVANPFFLPDKNNF